MTLNLLSQFIKSNHYDVRISHNGRWIDQKCAPDEISFVANCVVKYLEDNHTTTFISPSVWRSPYARANVQGYFAKPDPHNLLATDEYNKFFRQPLKMFSAAGILSECKSGSTIVFSVKNKPALEFIAQDDWKDFEFLCLYIEKTLRDSDLWDPFESFFDAQDSHYYDVVKEAFAQFCYNYTPIRNQKETARIFAKVLNPLAFKYKKFGTMRGHISQRKIHFSDLRYNRDNFRDVGKEKDVTRQEAAAKQQEEEVLPLWAQHKTSKAKKEVKQYNQDTNGGFTEVPSINSHGPATQMHHMFMESVFPSISDFRENVVALTPTQHMTMAHPNNNTSKIDPDFQRVCLLAKMNNVKLNILKNVGQSGFYDFNRLMEVLDVGFGVDKFQDVPVNDFTTVQHMIDAQY